MATVTKQFDSYSIYYNTSEHALIFCKSSGKHVGTIDFVKENNVIPRSNVTKPSGSTGEELHIYFPISNFNDIVNILRYEKPLYLVVYESGLGTLSTSSEPAGEQEP